MQKQPESIQNEIQATFCADLGPKAALDEQNKGFVAYVTE